MGPAFPSLDQDARLATVSGDLPYASCPLPKKNGVVLHPARAMRILGLTKSQRCAAGASHLHQMAARPKADPLAIRREKWLTATLGAADRNGLGLIERTQV